MAPGVRIGGVAESATLDARFLAACARDALLPVAGARLLVAVSGGADSLALWDLLARAGRWRLVLFHLDHRLRAEAHRDAELIAVRDRDYAAAGCAAEAVVVERAEVAALARRWRCGIEDAGRRQRYARLTALAAAHRCAAVLTAHHRDDQAETVLANLLRGAGPTGRAGIAPSRPLAPGLPLLRPLLDFTRVELRSHLVARGLTWNDDATNADTRYRRNRLRLAVLPALEAEHPGFTAQLLALAESNRTRVQELDATVDRWWAQSLESDRLFLAPRPGRRLPAGSSSLTNSDRPTAGTPGASAAQTEGSGVLAEATAVRFHAWRRLLAHLGLEIERRHLQQLDGLALGKSDRRFALGPLVFLRRAEALCWEPAAPAGNAEVATIAVAAAIHGIVARGDERLVYSTASVPPDPRGGGDDAVLDHATLHWPLVWRLPLRGERWRPLGCPGTQTLVKFLAERKTPSRSRRLTPVLADQRGIVWVPGFTIAERSRITAVTTMVVQLRRERLSQGGSSAIIPVLE